MIIQSIQYPVLTCIFLFKLMILNMIGEAETDRTEHEYNI